MFVRAILLFTLAVTLLLAVAEAAPPGASARYQLVSVTEVRSSEQNPAVSGVVLLTGPREMVDGSEYQWWELQVAKRNGEEFAFRVLSQGIPMTSGDEQAIPGRIVRYIFKEGDAQPVEYVHARTGLAYLPKFDFTGSMCPVSGKFTDWQKGFATVGTYLGHMLALQETGDGAEWLPWPEPLALRLDPDVLTYMSRMIKDTDDRYYRELGRDDHNYEPLTKEDVDELLSLGLNRWRVNDEQEEWVRLKPVLYYKFTNLEGTVLKYPETLYRSNYRGYNVFIDEPAHHMGPTMSKMETPEQAAHLLLQHVEENWNRPSGYRHRATLRDHLMSRDINLGTFSIVDDEYPIWETVPETAFYQLMGGPNGILHEGRWNLRESNAHFERLLGKKPNLTVDEMLKLYYADLRGAVRAFGDSWGTSIYGQCDPEVAPRALSLAYEMGARYFWFWASDKDHHLPYFVTKKLLRHLQEYAEANPRPSLDEMLRAPRTVIVLPFGYQALKRRSDVMWGGISVNARNSRAVKHRDVISAAIAEAIAAMRSGEDFDFAIDVGQDLEGYNRVLKIGLDARVFDSTEDTSTARLNAISEELSRLDPRKFENSTIRARIPYQPDVAVDGNLGEWNGVDWLVVDSETQYQLCPVFPQHAKPWGGPRDLSAQVAFARDEAYLYVAAKVTDDVYIQRRADENIWQGDGIEVALDLDLHRSMLGASWLNAFGGKTTLPRYAEFAIALTPNGPQVYMGRCPRGTIPRLIGNAKLAVEHGAEHQTFYEAAIPWNVVSPFPGNFSRFCGLSFTVNDSDEEHREGLLEFTPGIGVEKDPSHFALVEFEPIPAEKRTDVSTVISETSQVLRGGEELKISVDSMNDAEGSTRLIVTLDRAGHTAASGRLDVTLPQGRGRFTVDLDTSAVKPGVYACHVELREPVNDALIAESSFQLLKLE